MRHLLNIFLKLGGLFFSLLFQGLNLIISFVSILVGIVGFLNYICHFFSFLVQLPL